MKKRKRKNMRMTLFFNGPTFNMYLYHLFFSLFPACASETLILRRWVGGSEGSGSTVSSGRSSLFPETERLCWNSPDAVHCVTISSIDLALTGLIYMGV